MKNSILTILFFAYCTCSAAQPQQPAASRSLSYRSEPPTDSSVFFPIALYRKATPYSQFLYNGGRYHIYDRKAETHQFFLSRELTSGSLRYENRDYGPLQMYYDTHLGLIIVEQSRNKYLVQLQPRLVQSFTLNGHAFVQIDTGSVLKKGFYQLLYNGKTQVLCARKKERIERIVNQAVEVEFIEKDRFFIRMNGSWQEVTTRKRLLALLDVHRLQIRRHLRSNVNRFKTDKEQAITSAVELYDRLQQKL